MIRPRVPHNATWQEVEARRPPARSRAFAAAALLLDLLIALSGVALLVLATAEFDAGPMPPDALAAPILLLVVAVPLRVAVGGRSWLLHRLQRAMPDLSALKTRALARVPPSVVDVLLIVVVSRLAAFTIGFVANLVFPSDRERGFQLPFEYRHFAEIFAAWDSGWYFDIARRGYFFHYGHQSSVAFFPLYPMLMRAVAWPFGGGERALWLSGIAVSCTAFVAALIVLHRFTERVFGSREVARRTVTYLAIFPFSFFFTRIYTESVFLLTTVLAVSSAVDKRWLRAGLWGALAALCRPNGILIAVPLGLMALELDGNPPLRILARRFAPLALVPLALAGYSLYVYSLSGHPLGWLDAQKHWGNSIGNPPWHLLVTMIGQLVRHGWYEYFLVAPDAPFRLFHGLTALMFLIFIPAIFKRLGAAMGVYVLASLLVPLSASALEGIGRYASVLFPAFMLAGTVKSSRVHDLVLIVFAQFHVLFICLFVTLRPIY